MTSGYSGSTTNLLVGAIDFGTTFSGWAYSFYYDFKSDPTKGYTKHWYSDSGTPLATEKTLTVVLIRPDGKTLEAFGYDAENRYMDLVDAGEHHDYYYFRNFKMMLHKQLSEKLGRDALLSDEMGKLLTAIDVFAISIKYLVEDMHKMVTVRFPGIIKKSEVHWVLTVPAIWTDDAKQFMREAAEKAGIDRRKLSIALEPEAASIYCRHLPVEKTVNHTGCSISSLSVGTRYMVIDAGGGTTDITIHVVVDSDKIKEVKSASGGGWGGILVNQAYEDLIQNIVGMDVYKKFKSENTEYWLEITREFEVKKKSIRPEKEGRVVVRFPATLCQLFKEKTTRTLKEHIRNSADFSGQVTLMHDKMKFEVNVFKQPLKKISEDILQHVISLLKDDALSVSEILMVGGFSESPMLQEAIRNRFPYKHIVVPHDGLMAVLKGALICGHCPEFMTERILRYTYGLETTVPFVEGKHPERKRLETDIGARCNNVFDMHVKRNQIVKVGKPQVTRLYKPVYKKQRSMRFDFYATEKNTPKFVDEGCIKIGILEIDNIEGGLDCEVDVTLTFSGTEIQVEVVVSSTGQKTNAAVDFLG